METQWLERLVFVCAIGMVPVSMLLSRCVDPVKVRAAEDEAIRNQRFYVLILGKMLTPKGRQLWHIRNIMLGLALIGSIILSSIPYKP